MERPDTKDYFPNERQRFMDDRERYARLTLSCNCGATSRDGHSPDCLLEMGLEDSWREAADDWYFAHEYDGGDDSCDDCEGGPMGNSSMCDDCEHYKPDDRSDWIEEIAMEAGMLHGCDGYNEVKGWN